MYFAVGGRTARCFSNVSDSKSGRKYRCLLLTTKGFLQKQPEELLYLQ
jgi:hypothetical protein